MLLRSAFAAIVFIALAGCGGSSPGQLGGTWQAKGLVPMNVIYRDGEEEAMGIITSVSYKTQGKDVIVTYNDGLMKGTSIRYTIVDAKTARSDLITLVRKS